MTTTPTNPSAVSDGRELAGKYLTFRLGAEEYGLEILKVREIIGLMDVTPVPRTPDFVRGVINLRGRIIPVILLRAKFDMELVEDSAETCIIVVDATVDGSACQIGVLVDSVCEVLDIAEDDIEATPSFGAGVNSSYLRGMAKREGRVTMLLETDRILSGAETAAAKSVADAQAA